MSRMFFAVVALVCLSLVACSRKEETPALTAEEVRAIARDAYVYGYPMVDGYRIHYAYYVDATNPEYKGDWNEIHSVARVFTPADKAVQTPNSDTPYSMLAADLRTEPLVITVPEVDTGRYYSLQFIDLYTHNFAYVGSRTTGNGAGNYVLAGPGWTGQTPAGVNDVIRSETEIALVGFRTQLFNPADIEKVKRIQEGYRVHTLSEFLGTTAPPKAPDVAWIKPLTPQEQRSSFEFFNILNFVLQFCPTQPGEADLMARFAKLNIGAGKTFDVNTLKPEIRQAVDDGMKEAWEVFKSVDAQIAAGTVTFADMFGTRDYLKNNYPYRMAGAVVGIFGNSREEALYPTYKVDATGALLDGSKKYTLRFEKDQLPPVNAFWSVTMYEMPSSLLYDNALDRYLINSPMLPRLKKDKDGSLTIYVQHASPGPKLQSNWLPAPKGPFMMVMRLYWPKPEAYDGTWKQPPLVAAE